MSDKFTIEAETRNVTGKKVKQLRRAGKTPAVIYGRKQPRSIQMDTLAAYLTLRDAGENDLIDLTVDGKMTRVLARDVQRHVTRGDLIHIDFLEVDMDQKMEAEAAIILNGQSGPEQAGEGITALLLQSVQIEAKPDDLISEIEVDATQIETTDDVITVADLSVPAGVTILNDPEELVARFEYAREEEEPEEEDLSESIVGIVGEEDDDEADDGE